jgi:phosphatidylinositol kinase/protein kinase (PI-3  family)
LVDDADQIDIKAEGGPVLIGTELPFRLTPNLQDFITPIGIEGLLTASMLALGRGLTEPEVHFLFPHQTSPVIG